MPVGLNKKDNIVIQKMRVEDVEPTARLLMRMWLDTYVNEEYGITEEWVKERFHDRLKLKNIVDRQRKLLEDEKNPNKESYVARNSGGAVIGMMGFYKNEEGLQELGAIYVDKPYHGRGIADMLMGKLFEWANPKEPIRLGVVSYNERAKAFYKKWGFEEIAGTDQLFENKIPELMMIRKGDEE
jgi:ribosomal protein S18 acetylase RimI-like enzyme